MLFQGDETWGYLVPQPLGFWPSCLEFVRQSGVICRFDRENVGSSMELLKSYFGLFLNVFKCLEGLQGLLGTVAALDLTLADTALTGMRPGFQAQPGGLRPGLRR